MAGFVNNVLGGFWRFIINKKYRKFLGNFSFLLDAAWDAVEEHEFDLDKLAAALFEAAHSGKQFDSLQSIGRDWLKREGVELRDEVLGALINNAQLRVRVSL